METKIEVNKMDTISIEEGQNSRSDQGEHSCITSAHTIGQDSWQQVGLLLVTGFNCGFILSYSNLILVPLGWTWGVLCLFIMGIYALYANWLLATFHVIEGNRFIRYRDLMGFVYGKEMYLLTWIFQFLTLLLLNMGFILLGGRALKEINSEFSDSPLRLQYFIIVTGVVYFVFAFCVPTLSAMRIWLGISAILTSTYIVAVVVQCIRDGQSNTSRSYHVSGSKMDKVFNALSAISALLACNTSGMLPEIQSTLQQPAIKNMRKALYLQFTLGVIFYYGLCMVGYWAYGSTVSWYLPHNFSSPKWLKIVANATVFLQFIVSQSMFAAPIHEALDTKFLNLQAKMHSMENAKRLFLLRAVFFAGNSLIAAAFPYVGDFVSLIGSFMIVPLTFMFPSMVYLKLNGKTARLQRKIWHLFNIILSCLLAVATTMAAIRLIVKNARAYSVFADT